ncbi:hypothetical protein EDB86DRAFT_2835983 [Lactarius hatsudake]|nr:hypothetical protein EDB86DRAFT_2835983 [Lactarius hatsudake]
MTRRAPERRRRAATSEDDSGDDAFSGFLGCTNKTVGIESHTVNCSCNRQIRRVLPNSCVSVLQQDGNGVTDKKVGSADDIVTLNYIVSSWILAWMVHTLDWYWPGANWSEMLVDDSMRTGIVAGGSFESTIYLCSDASVIWRESGEKYEKYSRAKRQSRKSPSALTIVTPSRIKQSETLLRSPNTLPVLIPASPFSTPTWQVRSRGPIAPVFYLVLLYEGLLYSPFIHAANSGHLLYRSYRWYGPSHLSRVSGFPHPTVSASAQKPGNSRAPTSSTQLGYTAYNLSDPAVYERELEQESKLYAGSGDEMSVALVRVRKGAVRTQPAVLVGRRTISHALSAEPTSGVAHFYPEVFTAPPAEFVLRLRLRWRRRDAYDTLTL